MTFDLLVPRDMRIDFLYLFNPLVILEAEWSMLVEFYRGILSVRLPQVGHHQAAPASVRGAGMTRTRSATAPCRFASPSHSGRSPCLRPSSTALGSSNQRRSDDLAESRFLSAF